MGHRIRRIENIQTSPCLGRWPARGAFLFYFMFSIFFLLFLLSSTTVRPTVFIPLSDLYILPFSPEPPPPPMSASLCRNSCLHVIGSSLLPLPPSSSPALFCDLPHSLARILCMKSPVCTHTHERAYIGVSSPLVLQPERMHACDARRVNPVWTCLLTVRFAFRFCCFFRLVQTLTSAVVSSTDQPSMPAVCTCSHRVALARVHLDRRTTC